MPQSIPLVLLPRMTTVLSGLTNLGILVCILNSVWSIVGITSLMVAPASWQTFLHAHQELIELLWDFGIASTLGTIVLFMIWMVMMHRNLRRLGARSLEHSSVGAALWWIVPIANLFMPYLIMREITEESEARVGGGRRLHNLVPSWWALFVASNTVGFLAALFVELGRLETVKWTEVDTRVVQVLSLVGHVLWVGAGLLAMLLVHGVKQTQQLASNGPARADIRAQGALPAGGFRKCPQCGDVKIERRMQCGACGFGR